QGRDVEYVGMTADGTKVFFTTTDNLTPQDTDHSLDLYMWSQVGASAESVTLVSMGNNGAGNTNECSPAGGWTNGCDVKQGVPADSVVGDTSIASASGDIYFYSPELLDGSKGLSNQENLYVFRNGEVRFVAAFLPGGYCSPSGEACSNGPIGRMDIS